MASILQKDMIQKDVNHIIEISNSCPFNMDDPQVYVELDYYNNKKYVVVFDESTSARIEVDEDKQIIPGAVWELF